MTFLASIPSGVPAFTAARSMSPVEISENAFAGLGGGLAMDGRYKPIVEFMYPDFMWVAADQIDRGRIVGFPLKHGMDRVDDVAGGIRLAHHGKIVVAKQGADRSAPPWAKCCPNWSCVASPPFLSMPSALNDTRPPLTAPWLGLKVFVSKRWSHHDG